LCIHHCSVARIAMLPVASAASPFDEAIAS
jgi:hypothetical protein